MQLHLLKQVSTYGEQTLVNLVNQKGHEKPVKDSYERYISQVSTNDISTRLVMTELDFQLSLPKVRYEYFDFHNECKHMRWDRISVLIEKLQHDLQRQGCVSLPAITSNILSPSSRWFHINSDQAEPVKLQQGTVRTNCMDNLDRTNVVQAALAKWTLNQQLVEVGILQPGGTIDDYIIFSKDFRESELSPVSLCPSCSLCPSPHSVG